MTDTPETDMAERESIAAYIEAYGPDAAFPCDGYDHARKLERERDQWRQHGHREADMRLQLMGTRDDARLKLERERDEVRSDLQFRRGLYKVQEEHLETARRERDELRAKYAMHHAEAERMTTASRLPPPEAESPASIVVSDACSVERWVTVRTRAEFLYMREWIWMSGQKQPLLARPTEYPIALIVGGSGSPGWSDSLDRAANYVSFADFISQNEKSPDAGAKEKPIP